MLNDSKFIDRYLNKIRDKIRCLPSIKDELFINLYIHFNYNVDGRHSISQIKASIIKNILLSCKLYDIVKNI